MRLSEDARVPCLGPCHGLRLAGGLRPGLGLGVWEAFVRATTSIVLEAFLSLSSRLVVILWPLLKS